MDTMGLKIGDKVMRGNGKKVMTITNFRPGWGSVGTDKTFATLNGGTMYDVTGLRLAASDAAPAERPR